MVADIPLGVEAVEVGSAARCDLQLVGAGLSARAWLVYPRRGTVWVRSLDRPRAPARVLAAERPWPLCGELVLVRRESAGDAPTSRDTAQLSRPRGAAARWRVHVGRRPGGRSVEVADEPVEVGSDRRCVLTLHDRAVSARHLRLEPAGAYLVVRDLDSRNGTYLGGAWVSRARITGPAQLRVGRTDLWVAPVGTAADAASPVAVSEGMRRTFARAARYARLPWPTLVSGESGAGKEAVARALHDGSDRAAGPFVALNAGGLAPQLVESELFGHERGAFTGAESLHRGVFEQAQGGTLFLDEVGELPLAQQARLLRVLETWQVRRVGGERPVDVDVRLVCATHRDLRAMVRAGGFREDLYYRLARLVLQVPPLRARPDDIGPLAERFLADAAEDVGPRELSAEALRALRAHRWPGNVRELRNVVCAAAAQTGATVLEREDIEAAITGVAGACVRRRSSEPPIALRERVAQYRNTTEAARALGVPRTTLRDRLKRAAG